MRVVTNVGGVLPAFSDPADRFDGVLWALLFHPGIAGAAKRPLRPGVATGLHQEIAYLFDNRIMDMR
jgi:hypothetical protein